MKKTAESVHRTRAKRFSKTPPLKEREMKQRPSVIAVHNSRDARRLLSRVISEVQGDEIDLAKAKGIAYLLQVYIGIERETELEERIQKLEQLASERRVNDGL